MRIRPGITIQRVISYMDGKERENPIHPISREKGIVEIGNQRTVAVKHTAGELLAVNPIKEYNDKKQARRPHECGAALIGEMCGHA